MLCYSCFQVFLCNNSLGGFDLIPDSEGCPDACWSGMREKVQSKWSEEGFLVQTCEDALTY